MSDIAVILPDGTELSVEEGATVRDAAFEIGPGLGKDTVAGVVDGELVDKETPLHDGANLVIVTDQSDEYLDVLRHSAAHVFAQALQRLYPEAKLTIGPWTDDGFYYDVTDVDLEKEDLEAIEDEMRNIIEEDLDIERTLIDREEALEKYADNPYKRDILETEAAGDDELSFYQQGEFEDLCKGPHVDSTGDIGAVKLLNISAAYWRGDEENDTLTRVYGTAFESESELEEFLEMREEAAERDHRKLGQELDLFSIPSVTGPGLPLYHPNGKKVLQALETYGRDLNESYEYDYVETPHLFRTELWKQSGHYDNYQDDMFLLDVNDEEYGLKPMNCPGHATIFKQGSWSYRDLPVRYAENGKVYRKEQRGELSGLSRVWAFTIDDGHLFVRPDQIEQEVEDIMDIILEVLQTFDLDYEVALATRPEKSVGSDEIWEQAESQLKSVLEDSEMDYFVEEGDGAFYGPKIDFSFEDALGRKWDGPTVQLDFNMPERFELSYTGEDNEEHRPVMIHRALYGSFERFFMVLIEHYNGKFPTWLAPEQVRILPISDDQIDYAESIKEDLGDFRVTIEDRSWTLGRKIREAQTDRVPYMIIVGGNEEEAGTISVRDRKERETQDVSVEEFRDHLVGEVDDQRVEPGFLDEE
ncbi:threonine--tRNA ligase [Haloferax mediterranei ATCC 33500]|uniref:Threonine--tRNA ligase n=1 Tax=Haloferax mediterranei (strain ATCC 33500 / DSM 1411 / JCM 8866 / NBRC 14739 / NCIMB 2177 / R-4) TaxID=523841 RepID=I3R5H0_HALMT|nr:threonine--tRNA ligase [Haloferax mediterranei]AFK19480.1 threonyl-tRNA synthetase [Haloferax mediterranei ATCC 33500]AHZ21175.1 threonyl-tRNA synthetase [Haloferax mediterranei ATCC 33500]EMA04332.1 threonyl-tRNA ligase [Haloferax mediterranei ATCC 33500]MDX5989583.1 threonine--tRNA ligase [Haloferax mediterranei ATCC 33500]QCQ75941.1 threonine--tRNA ligase [Haloferax mediterranei ATCC 33500]